MTNHLHWGVACLILAAQCGKEAFYPSSQNIFAPGYEWLAIFPASIWLVFAIKAFARCVRKARRAA